MRQAIRIGESELIHMISESVKKILDRRIVNHDYIDSAYIQNGPGYSLNENHSNSTIYEIYNGKDGGAYRSSRYLAKAITSEGKERLYSSFPINEGIDFEPSPNERGGVIVFSTDVNAEKLSENKFINWIKQKMMTIGNRLNARKKIDRIAAANDLVGWTIGHYLDGRYTAKNGKQYGENSLSVEIIGVNFETLLNIAMELCSSFTQESVLLKDSSSGKVLFVNTKF